MVNELNIQTVYTVTGDPDTLNTSTLYKLGELGAVHANNDRVYQRVRLDSGATSSTSVGAVAANQLAYWKDKDTYLVTNDSAQAIGTGASAFRNQVAGVFRNAATADNYIDVLQRGDNIPIADGGNTFAIGESVIAEAGTAAAADRIAVGTAPTYRTVGIARGAASGGNVNVDVDIPATP
jgi:hypothetical protein